MVAEELPVIFIMGPTASGKTSVAATLFEHFDCELISVDAAQVFRDMNIGTAKPGIEFLKQFPHHLIDIRNFDQPYSAAEFCKDASELIALIQSKGKVPVFVGGTMFYFSALENGLSDLPSSNAEIRVLLEQQIQRQGIESLHKQLLNIDPELGEKINPTDQQRVQRAMEIYSLTGEPPSVVMSRSRSKGLALPPIKIALSSVSRKVLHQGIEKRFRSMIDNGLVEEVEELLSGTENPETLVSMKSVGYRQVVEFLHKKVNHQDMIENAIAATRQLAKRQLTWLRNQSNVVWFNCNCENLQDSISIYLKSGHHSVFSLRKR